MAKIKYNKAKGLHSVIKKSVEIDSVAGAEYESLYPSVRREIQKKDGQYAAAFNRASRIRISGQEAGGYLKPEVEAAIQNIAEVCKDGQEETTIEGVNLLEDVFPICLSVEGDAEPVAQYLKVKNEKLISRKASNIFFHPKALMGVVCDLLLFAPDITRSGVYKIIIRSFKLFYQICVGCELQMDEASAKTVLMIYELSNGREGVEEERLLQEIQKKYPEENEKVWQNRVNQLLKYRCIEIEDGKVRLKESIR